MIHTAKKGLFKGVELDSTSQPEYCNVCAKAKAVCLLFPMETETRAKMYGAMVHTDLWGLSQTVSLGGCSYYISFMDDYTCETMIFFLKAKSGALAAYKQYEAHLSRQNPGVKVWKVWSDHGGEYLSAEFDQYLYDEGIK